ncbi:MAG: CRISPR-associated protein [Chloroflexi bacterium]|nr:CRISPR-associated protein [Chloroflexota bacterium]
MHRRLVNELTLELALVPRGPVLIRAAETGLDPTRAEMEFVRGQHGGEETVYLPGSTLKGALRAHCERLARTLEGGNGDAPRLACNPLSEAREGPGASCSARLRRETGQGGEHLFRESCVVCQLFGNIALAARLRVSDAYPLESVRVEQRASVAIDRVYSTVASGPLTYEVATTGAFGARLTLHNFALGHLGLLALTLRDLDEGRCAIGYGKSRGLGQVGVRVTGFAVRYPGCTVRDGQLVTLNGTVVGLADQLHGAGQFPDTSGYAFPADDATALPAGTSLADDGWGAASARMVGDQLAALPTLWSACVERWAALALTRGGQA